MTLEQLEDRMVPSAASSNMVAGVNNATVNPAPQSIGVVVPATTNAQQNNSGLAAATFPATSNTTVLGVLAATQTQGQLYGQFRAVSVNSQGQIDQFNQMPWNNGAFGFGSGTQPGQPWAPAAYNVGLANHQFAFSSSSDQGLQAPPPWTRPIDYNQEIDAESDQDSQAIHPLGAAEAPVADEDKGQADEEGTESNTDDLTTWLPSAKEHAVPTRNSERTADEESLSADARLAQEALLWKEGFSYAVGSLPDDHRAAMLMGDDRTTESEQAEVHLSDLPTLSSSLSLSGLTPLQFSALVTGLALSTLQIKGIDEDTKEVSEEWEEVPAA